ncbi:hypothetical protein Csa_014601, partial [Cucumis sativus]
MASGLDFQRNPPASDIVEHRDEYEKQSKTKRNLYRKTEQPLFNEQLKNSARNQEPTTGKR